MIRHQSRILVCFRTHGSLIKLTSMHSTPPTGHPDQSIPFLAAGKVRCRPAPPQSGGPSSGTGAACVESGSWKARSLNKRTSVVFSAWKTKQVVLYSAWVLSTSRGVSKLCSWLRLAVTIENTPSFRGTSTNAKQIRVSHVTLNHI